MNGDVVGRASQLWMPDVTCPKVTSGIQTSAWNIKIYCKQKERVINVYSWLTLAMASTNAPFLSKQRTTSICPARAAIWRAVSPRWQSKAEDF